MRSRIELASGTELSFLTAGEPSKPALLLLHGFPSSSRTFRNVIPALSKVAYVVAPDMPGFGMSDALPEPSFDGFADAISELLSHLSVGPRHIYLHDFGAPVGLRIAMQAPDAVLGLIIQNANAHRSGMGPSWKATQDFWVNPNPDNEAKATAHLTFEGTRDQYVAGVPDDVVAQIPHENWEEDWRVMQRPGGMETQHALVADYGNYVARFDAIADYLRRRQPRALMLWGRHDTFFDLAETLSWMQALPRMEAHILDGPHFLLETHANQAASFMVDFLERQ
ncbi:alpha/beta hydrolase [Mesorhizobium sp. CA8]|uniref:alpha/beta fold hydrolase n=1 Tax=Mesorhizobium sp. CA8 TaxID=2876637 RepID=UPI001CCCC69E|nr:alpha/beta hydrolase [Mesorhizobium sp. CA8]MBZ9759630.1 alpha/beta hydrolase [Mesorhizobium sp. CA8]